MTGESSGVNASTAGTRSVAPGDEACLGTAAPAARCVDSAGPMLHCQSTQTVRGRFVQEASNSPGHSASEPIEPRKTNPTKSPQGCSERSVGHGTAEPFSTRRRLVSAGKNWVGAPVGVPGVGEDGMVRQSSGERGKVSVPAKSVPYGAARSYNCDAEVERRGRDWQRRTEYAMTPGVTHPGRAKVLWVRVVQQPRRWPAHRGREPSVLISRTKAAANQA